MVYNSPARQEIIYIQTCLARYLPRIFGRKAHIYKTGYT